MRRLTVGIFALTLALCLAFAASALANGNKPPFLEEEGRTFVEGNVYIGCTNATACNNFNSLEYKHFECFEPNCYVWVPKEFTWKPPEPPVNELWGGRLTFNSATGIYSGTLEGGRTSFTDGNIEAGLVVDPGSANIAVKPNGKLTITPTVEGGDVSFDTLQGDPIECQYTIPKLATSYKQGSPEEYAGKATLKGTGKEPCIPSYKATFGLGLVGSSGEAVKPKA
jgi:hypothetical protein